MKGKQGKMKEDKHWKKEKWERKKQAGRRGREEIIVNGSETSFTK